MANDITHPVYEVGIFNEDFLLICVPASLPPRTPKGSTFVTTGYVLLDMLTLSIYISATVCVPAVSH